MRILFDSSAIAKRYKKEAGHQAVEALLQEAETVVLAAHARVEVATSLAREFHDGAIELTDYDAVMTYLADDFADFDVKGIDRVTEGLALAAVRQRRLSAMDALHLGTALANGVDLFVTADAVQADVARAMGLKTRLITETTP